ncbi:hypothetical protein KUTeg_007840 [Tegillarca granosa]|uniref:Inositol polyphosphate-related phosphatase domain-containing protein n=1 Tax=Tegillarca granosa TaxID=220873 RepID=A0ABQ9FJ35_TEGGR|nr:hypothetical protein KUTeg_007840 [Tegillarca granosa]
MDPNVLVQRKLGQDEKCLMCVIGRLIDGFAKFDRYVAIVEKLEDHGIFILSSKRVPAFSSDELKIEDVLSVDGNLRALQETVKSEDPSLGTNLVLNLRTSNKKMCIELPNDKWSLQFMAELKRCQDVESQIAAFGLPSSFKWLDKYRSNLETQTSTNPFANDVFDPLKYMNIENTQGETVVDNMPGKPVVSEQKFSDNFTDSLSLNDIKVKSTMMKSASRDSLDILETNNENGLTDSVGKITEQLGIAGSGVDLGEQLKPASARENLVRFFMTEREDEFTYKQNLRVFCGTWNVNGQSPGPSLREWLAVDPSPPDVYAIGFQELDLSNQAYIFSDSPKETEWQNAVRSSLHPKAKYKKVKLIRLVGVMLIVYVKEEHAAHVKFIDTDSVPTGILGIMGNKGGVGVRMTIRSTSLLFINSHLAAHQEEYERRNQDYRDIDSKMRFRQFVPPLRIDEHDLVFWIGDLNYRIADLDIDKVKAMIDKENFHDLIQYDQVVRRVEFLLGVIVFCIKELALNNYNIEIICS